MGVCSISLIWCWRSRLCTWWKRTALERGGKVGNLVTALFWDLSLQSQGTGWYQYRTHNSSRLLFLHSVLWLGYPKGHMSSLFQIKADSSVHDCICFTVFLYLRLIRLKKKKRQSCGLSFFSDYKSSKSSLEKIQKVQNSGKIYMRHISFLTFGECLLRVWFFVFTLSSCSHEYMWRLFLFSRWGLK